MFLHIGAIAAAGTTDIIIIRCQRSSCRAAATEVIIPITITAVLANVSVDSSVSVIAIIHENQGIARGASLVVHAGDATLMPTPVKR